VVAGKDINVKGSNVISDTGTTLAAGNNLSIEAAQNTSSSTSFYEKKESGLLDGEGAGITVGTREQSTEQKNRGTTAAASTVGSIAGNVTLVANEVYKQVGSDVMAPGGDVTIVAKKVDIVEARETSRSETEQKFKQTGLTLEVTIACHQRHANHRQDERSGQRHQRQPHARPGPGQCRLCRQERL
jgi:filamentous hemagglutinin